MLAQDRARILVFDAEEFSTWCDRRKVKQTGHPVCGPARALTRKQIERMVLDILPDALDRTRGRDIRYTGTCCLCKKTFKAIGSRAKRDALQLAFRSHWHDNMKCKQLRAGWSEETYSMAKIEKVFFRRQPPIEQLADLIRLEASTRTFIDTLVRWCHHLAGDLDVVGRWISTTLTNQATSEDISFHTRRFEMIMKKMSVMGYVCTRDAADVGGNVDEVGDGERPPPGPGSSTARQRVEDRAKRRQMFIQKVQAGDSVSPVGVGS